MLLLTQETTNESVNAVSQNPSMQSFVYILYGGLILFFIYRIYKTNLAKKNLEGEVYKYDRPSQMIMWILGVVIAAFGVFNIYSGEVISGVLMIALIIVLFFEYTSKNLFANNGFIIDAKFVTWKELQKWAFDTERGELIVNYKKGFDEKQALMKLKKEDINTVDELIRKHKLKR